MAIKGKTFDLQTITAKDDGALYRILSGESDMIVFSGSGTALSINSNILTIAECYLLVGGRYIHIEDGSTIDLGTIPNSSNRGRVIIMIDTSLGATQVTLDQVVPEIETIASGGSYRALVKNDINSDNGGSVYEIEFATFTCSSGVASSPALTTSVPTQSIIQTLQDDIETLADNLEQTASDVGDLQALGLSVPIPVNMGGTGASTQAGAQSNLGILPHVYYTSQYNFYPLTQELIDDLYLATRKNAIVSLTAADGMRPLCLINWGNADYGCVSVFSQRPELSFDQWQKNGGVWTHVTASHRAQKVTYTSEALTGLNAKQLKAASSTNLIGTDVADVVGGRNYITLGKGVYRIHTHFATKCPENGFIKSCLKIGNDIDLFMLNDQFYAGAGAGSSSAILGVNASDVISVTSDSGVNIYFLVMSSGNADGFNASMTIEQIHP